MRLVQDFIELITIRPSALVYHLVILFSIQLIAGVAIGHWRRRRDEPATRMLVMGIGLFLARAILMLVALLDSVGLVPSAAVFPPLERFLQLVSYLLVVWALLSVLEENQRLGTAFLLASTLVAAGAYAVSASLWADAQAQGVVYVGQWQERAWEWSITVFLALSLAASLVWRARDWGWLACLIALWLLGHLLQLVSPIPRVDTAGWVRLSNLAALPLLAAVVFRRALEPAPPLDRPNKVSDAGALRVFEALELIISEGTLGLGLELAATSVARTLDADMAVIGLLAPGPVDVMRVVALHPTPEASPAKRGTTLLLSNHPVLVMASRGPRQERVTTDESGASPVHGLYQRLGFDASGPLLVQPLTTGDDVLGLLLVGNPASKQEWTARDEQIVQSLGVVLGRVIAEDEEREAASGK